MTHQHPLGDPAELAALFAAGAMPLGEQVAFEAHLADGCAACSAELRALTPVVTALAGALAPVLPDAAVRDKLLRRVTDAAGLASGASPLRAQLHSKLSSAKPGAPLLIKRAADAAWEATEIEGVRIRVLFVDRAYNHFTALVRMAPGTSYPAHLHDGPEECLVLEGDLRVGEQVLHAGDYQRAPAGSHHGIQSTQAGCLLMITSSLSDVFL
jgi:anti-sigma factor ChrR (cupin superfamily)